MLKKNLDCVKLKNSIQARLLKEYEGIGEEQKEQYLQHKLKTSNSIVAHLWRQIQEEQKLKKAS